MESSVTGVLFWTEVRIFSFKNLHSLFYFLGLVISVFYPEVHIVNREALKAALELLRMKILLNRTEPLYHVSLSW